MAAPLQNQRVEVLFELWSAKNVKLRPLKTAFNLNFYPTLDGHGTGTFTMYRDDPAVRLIRKDCIIHVYVNGTDVFQWIIESESSSFAESSGYTLTYTGQGMRSYLDRAMIYPTGWPPADHDPRLPQYGFDILNNGNFEQVTTGVLAPNWTVSALGGVAYDTPVGSGVEKNEKNEITGRAFVANNTNPNAAGNVLMQGGLFNANFSNPLAAGGATTKWRLSAAAKVESPAANYAGGMRIYWFNSQGAVIGWQEDRIKTASVWNRLEIEIDVPAAATQYRVDLWIYSTGKYSFDLVKLQVVYVDALPIYPQTPTPTFNTGPNLIQGNDFEWARGITYVPTNVMGWSFDQKVPIIMAPIIDYHKPPFNSIMTVQRNNPTLAGRVAWHDLPVQAGKVYSGSIWVMAGLYPGSNFTAMGADKTFIKRVFLDGGGNPIGTPDEGRTRMVNPTEYKQIQLGNLTAPVGAAYIRHELWADSGLGSTAPPTVQASPSWTLLDVRETTVIQPDDTPPGTWKAFQRMRLPEIIKEIVNETRGRLQSEWPVTTGVLEYDEDYDVIDGVVVPRDERTAIFRLDNVGVALTNLTAGAGDLIMENMTLHYFKQYGRDLSRTVAFREGIDVISVPENVSSTKDIKTKLVVEGQGDGINAVAIEISDPALVSQYGIREGYLDRKGVPHLIDLRKEGIQAFKEMTRASTALTITVSTHKYLPYRDYKLGDLVTVSVPKQGIQGTYRIRAMRPVIGATINAVDLELNAVNYDIFVKILRQQQTQGSSLSVTQRFPQGQVTLYQVNDEGQLDATHPYTFRFYVPNTPLFANGVQVAFQGLPFRTNVKINTNASQSSPAGSVPSRTIVTPTSSSQTRRTSETGDVSSGNPDSGQYWETGSASVDFLGSTHHHSQFVPDTRLVKHSHEITIPGHTHNVLIPSIPEHTHTLPIQVEYGIFEQGNPTGLTFSVNDVLIDKQLYGYTDSGGTDIEIGRWVKKGWNTVKFNSNSLGAVAVQIVVQAYINSEVQASD